MGRVQGVGFRDFVRREAESRHLTGWVRNGDDGSTVEFVAEGDDDALRALLTAVRAGPRFSHVDGVIDEWSDASLAFTRFSVEM